MSYGTRGPKPHERASKSSHHHIINDPKVAEEICNLKIPPEIPNMLLDGLLVNFEPEISHITDVIAIDGGYTEVPLREGYPGASLHFFQFGALHFTTEDLRKIEIKKHIAPEDMQRLKNIDRLKFPLATRGARRKVQASLLDSVRYSLYDFLRSEKLGESTSLLETLAWFLFRKYKNPPKEDDKKWTLGSSPFDDGGEIELNISSMSLDFTFECPRTGKKILLSDTFRLHELIDEEQGASGVAGYVAGIIEHLILLHIVKSLIVKQATALSKVLFIIDRPTGWFGVTAPMHKPMLELCNWLFEKHDFYLAGLEKSGAFVEHAIAIQSRMPHSSVLVLNDEYIYNFISPGQEDPTRPYASTSYYGTKVIFRTTGGNMHVVSMPVKSRSKNPKKKDIPNLFQVLTHVERLHCDLYENALLPVALANKLVSLSAHPSSQILKAFAKDKMGT